VRGGQLDMVILSRFGHAMPNSQPGLREWVLGRDPLRLCVPTGHRLSGATSCSLAELRDEPWIISPTSTLGSLTTSLCIAAGFQPTVVASVDDVATAIGLVTLGWGVTIAPDLTPAGSESAVTRIPLDGVETVRSAVLIVMHGEHLSPRIAAVVSAVHAANGAVRNPL
jgi:DNA-binding transcriptional LysR family regulator